MPKLILKGGRVIVDPSNELDKMADVVIDSGHILRISGCVETAEEDIMISAVGCVVTPGLVDHHAHLYPLAGIGIPAEFLPSLHASGQ